MNVYLKTDPMGSKDQQIDDSEQRLNISPPSPFLSLCLSLSFHTHTHTYTHRERERERERERDCADVAENFKGCRPAKLRNKKGKPEWNVELIFKCF